mmetsp:Transcript_55306/g.96722  ORF Transcript_55306/g.96722 Transcript_55306/m.96722 type:complete len:113 (-) Transcript_55306:123-461(-)
MVAKGATRPDYAGLGGKTIRAKGCIVCPLKKRDIDQRGVICPKCASYMAQTTKRAKKYVIDYPSVEEATAYRAEVARVSTQRRMEDAERADPEVRRMAVAIAQELVRMRRPE